MVHWNRTPFPAWGPSLNSLQNQADSFLRQFAEATHVERQPPVRLTASEDQVTLVALVPGIEPEALNVQAEGQVLKLSHKPTEGTQSPAAFERSYRLPFRLDVDGIQAELKHGRLTVTGGRDSQDAPRSIPIASETE